MFIEGCLLSGQKDGKSSIFMLGLFMYSYFRLHLYENTKTTCWEWGGRDGGRGWAGGGSPSLRLPGMGQDSSLGTGMGSRSVA